MPSRAKRIVVVGAGIAGSLIIAGLADRDDIELICLERVTEAGHADSGTGLNLGPNALTCLRHTLPERARAIVENGLPWNRWMVSLTDGRLLMDLDLRDVADDPGVRIRWAELYTLLRRPIARFIRYGVTVKSCRRTGQTGELSCVDAQERPFLIPDIDLLIAGDGRYSVLRDTPTGGGATSFLGVCLHRLLIPADGAPPIDDYAQWFNGPNRLLAFRVPGDFIYCAGSFPIPEDAPIPEALKQPEALRQAYLPPDRPAAPEVAYLVDAVATHAGRLHWARLQNEEPRYTGSDQVLLVGDAAHPMVPTLGQGATQAIEDACVVVQELRRALDARCSLSAIPAAVEERRHERIRFVSAFSIEATDTMLAGSDPVAGTLRKREPAFIDKLRRLYRDVPYGAP